MDIAKLKELAEKATPGPWACACATVVDPDGNSLAASHDGEGWFQSAEDAEFVAVARTAIPELIALVERQEEELAEARNAAESAKAGTFQVPTNKESLTVAADAPGKPMTVDSPEFWTLANKWSSPDQFKSRAERGAELVAHIDAHTARAVAAKQAEIDRLMLEFCADEMSAEQMATWEASQIRSPEAAPQQHAQAALSDMTTDEAREYLVKFMEQHFTDTTYHRYILSEPGRNGLAGDFAWQMARALRIIASQQPAAAPGVPVQGPDWTEEDQREQDYFDRHPDVPAAPATPQQEVARDELSADQIEELMPENEGNNGAFPCDKCGWVQVSAQWLHDFARAVDRRRAALAAPAAPAAQVAAVPASAGYRFPVGEDGEYEIIRADDGSKVGEVFFYVDALNIQRALAAAPSPAQPAPGADGNWPQDFRDVIKGAEDAAHQQGRAAGIEEVTEWLIKNKHILGITADSAIRALAAKPAEGKS